MKTFYLQFVLKSDAAFGRGDGVAGAIDNEVQHDDLGCPFLNGKEIKGILAQECAGVLAGLPEEKRSHWKKSAKRLFGQAGSSEEDSAWMAIGDARLPEDLTAALRWDRDKVLEKARQANPEQFEVQKQELMNEFRTQVLESITTVRQQTAMDEETGVAKDHSLRVTRMIIRETPFAARLDYCPLGGYTPGELAKFESDDLALLAACVAAFRRAGAGRNRGHGRLVAELQDERQKPIQKQYLQKFAQEVRR